MTLDTEACWRAFSARDRRFEGRFVGAVTTTGVYCRPGCPARMPARRNLSFYAHPAAAEADGFRPCRRCRPDASPGSPAWRGTSATVARALRLIDDGALGAGGVEALAGRLGLSSRRLRQLFEQHVGASPLDVAHTRRAHFARRLLESTTWPLPDIAAASGFASARRLHAAVRRTFKRAPGALRGAADARGALALRLPVRAPFDADAMLAFLGSRAIPGVEQVDGGTYRRSVRLASGAALVEVYALPDGTGLALAVDPPATPELLTIAARVERLFDTTADTRAIAAHLRRDPLLRDVIGPDGLRVPGAWDPFELAVRAMLGQQVSVAAARTLAARLVAHAGERLATPRGTVTHVFPSAAAVADTRFEALGVTGARARALRALGSAVANGALDFGALTSLDHAIEALTALPGIGDWTAHYVAMRALGEPDAFIAGDLGVRKALAGRGTLPRERDVLARAERWRPWRAYAVFALWRVESAATLRRTQTPKPTRRRPRKETQA